MRKSQISREDALKLLMTYNKDTFHIRHALTVESIMRYFANKLGYSQEEDYWGIVGLLHDLDYEMWPDEHCIKVVELLKDVNVDNDMVDAICSHGYGHRVDIEPKHEMEKILYACDELTGLIGACALMRPSKSCKDMELKSLKKKFKDIKFAAGCNRDIINKGADMLGWDIDRLLEETLLAMKDEEEIIENQLREMNL
ncbi:HD domain-containing protein [Peptoanaerobacter stomatis]